MFFKKRFEDSVNSYKLEISKLQETIETVKLDEEFLNELRAKAKEQIIEIEALINSIANTPKEFDKEFEIIDSDFNEILDIHNVDNYLHELKISLRASNFLLAFGASCLAVSGLCNIQKNEYIEEEETLQDDIEETNDISISDDVSNIDITDENSNGSSTDNFGVLALLVGAISLGIGTAIRPISYFKKSKEIYDEVEKIKVECYNLNKYNASINKVQKDVSNTYDTIQALFGTLLYLKGANYNLLDEDEKTRLWELVQYAGIISKLLHQKIEVS